jgi:hypothetical protein
MMTKMQIREILLNTYAPESVGNGGYKSDLAYKLCNHDVGVNDLISANYDDIVVEAFKEAELLRMEWTDFPELS